MSRATHPRLMAARLIERCRSAVVLSHVRPDGDAVGSATALNAVIRAMGKRSRVFLPERFPSRYG